MDAYARIETADAAVWVRCSDNVPVADSAEALHGFVRAGQVRARGPAVEGRLLSPAEPTKIVCVGLNYLRHAHEMDKAIPDEPLLFLKPSTALLAPGGIIELPSSSNLVHHEGELAVVLGAKARGVAVADALDYVLGVTCLNDVTARDIQRREKRYTRAKGFDTFAPCGPAIWTGVDPQALRIATHVNGERRQESGTDDMIFPVAQLISFVSEIMTLMPGDILTTGTPSGVGPLTDGDTVTVTLTGGPGEPLVLTNTVRRT